MVKCDFKVSLLSDDEIYACGQLDTNDKIKPLKWCDYGLRWFFPNNPYDPICERPQRAKFDKLRDVVLSDEEFLPLLTKYADEVISILQDEYIIDINTEN